MSRLIDADSLVLFPNNPESGTNEMIANWIDECGLSNLELYITEDCPVDVEHALKELCWKVIQGYINVIETEPTAYNVDKVVEQLGRRYKDCQNGIFKYHEQGNQEMVEICFNRGDAYIDASEIVRAGGLDDNM